MIDRHHIFHTRQHWTATKEAKLLRDMYLYPLDRKVHEEIHRECPPVPLLGYYALSNVLSNVSPIKEPKHDLDEVMSAIELSTQHKRAHPLERELGLLSIEAIRLQLPFIVPSTKTIIDLSESQRI